MTEDKNVVKDVVKQLVTDPQVQPEKETDIWKSIFEDGWYATDNLELKISRLFQDFEIKRREHNGTSHP